MAPLCPAQLMTAYREVCDVPRALPTAVPRVPSPSTLVEMREELGSCGVAPGEFSEALLLLWLLSTRMLRDEGCDGCADEKDAALRRLFMSSRLSAKLQQQLTDSLAVSSGALPQWCRMTGTRGGRADSDSSPSLRTKRPRLRWRNSTRPILWAAS